MAHHKRRRPKNRRAGCLMCKPWKANGASDGSRYWIPKVGGRNNIADRWASGNKFKPSEKRRLQRDKYETENYGY